jgi:FkbM family methyltransferase
VDRDAAAKRIDAVTSRLHHYDRSQLSFQLVEIVGELSYLRHGIEVREGAVVLDVGANVGVATLLFALHCGAGAVHCFEPVAPIAALLRENVRGLPACKVHEYGLSRAPGRATITYYPQSAAMSGLYADPCRDRAMAERVLINFGATLEQAKGRIADRYEAQTLSCELRTLSEVLREEGLERIDLLKIDVEGAELDVLDGIEPPDWPKIAQIVLEVHDEGARGETTRRRLEQHGFEVEDEQDPAMRGTPIRLLYATRP